MGVQPGCRLHVHLHERKRPNRSRPQRNRQGGRPGTEAGTTYFYRFWWNEHVSPIGQTKTAPAPNALEPVKLAVVSCAHYEAGYFYGYGEIAQRSDVDVVVHLGDYIYEYGPWKAGWKVPGRVHVPDHEIVSLNDYRTRYAQYHRDPNLQAMHAAHPVIAIWDDHEIANNSFATGADNHQENEGDYAARRQAAMQAYYEWMPVREEDPPGLPRLSVRPNAGPDFAGNVWTGAPMCPAAKRAATHPLRSTTS